VNPIELPESVTIEVPLETPQSSDALRLLVARRLAVPESALPGVVLRKRSLDCRGGRVRYHLSFELFPCEARSPEALYAEGAVPGVELGAPAPRAVSGADPVIVVGDGPCGLFCAYQLARAGIATLVLDRGKPVQPRRKDLKGLTRRSTVDPDSNYCFGEGGAGTYSDGKLYTRSHKRGDVRDVLEILVAHGAAAEILVDARPHIGSNKLPEIIVGLRQHLESVGVEFRFGARVVDVLRAPGSPTQVNGVRLADGSELAARAVVLATGHSARDVFHMLHAAGHPLEAKPFAVGVRIEHPQALINQMQYGKFATDPRLPSAAYKLVDSRKGRPAFSFCMCPGGFIVPASTSPGELVVNGMSPSRRNSKYANSGLVVGVELSDLAAVGLHGPLAGLEFQARMEQAAFVAGGSTLAAPATRVTDFLARKASTSVAASSYVPGLVAGDIGESLDASGLALAERLRTALEYFDRSMRGYKTAEASLIGIESRTSSPVRVPRNPETLESPAWRGLYPGGEGAGYAGGIVSAAVDGMRIAREITRELTRG
jgi:uncharacterized FAD-dependent dehydrogenase